MAAESPNNYYVRLDIAEHLDVFDLESFIGYRIKLTAGGILPHLVVEFKASGLLADNLKKELREETNIKFYEGLNRDEAKISNWTVTQPMFQNLSGVTTFRIECLLSTLGYDSQNLTQAITGTSIDVMENLAIHYLGTTADVIADPQDEMNWSLGLSVPQEAMTKTQVRYWGSESPNTALTFAVPETGPVIIRDLKMTIDRGPRFEIRYDENGEGDLPTIDVAADYVINAHSAFQSRIGGVNRISGFTEVEENGSFFSNISDVSEFEPQSPFAGSRIESTPTYSPNAIGRIDWMSMLDRENVHENWVNARLINLAQLTRAMDVSIVLASPTNLQDVNLLDVVLFREQSFDRQLLDTFSGLYFITQIERVYEANSNAVVTALTISKDGA